jgi:hypothetical protein
VSKIMRPRGGRRKGKKRLFNALTSFATTALLVISTLAVMFLFVGTGCVIVNNLSQTSGIYGEELVIYGSGFGNTQGSSQVIFGNDVYAGDIISWGPREIRCEVPGGALSGPLRVKVGNETSNNKNFTVLLGNKILELNPNEDYSPFLISDMSENDNDAYVEGDVCWTFDKNKEQGKAVYFYDPESHMELKSDRGMRHMEAIALIMDVKVIPSTADRRTIIAKRDCFKLELKNSSQGYYLVFGVWDNSGNLHTTSSDPYQTQIPEDFFNVCGYYDGNVLKIFLNGKEVAGNDAPDAPLMADITSEVRLGCNWDGSNPLDGTVGKTYIYDYQIGEHPGDKTQEFLIKADLMFSTLRDYGIEEENTQEIVDAIDQLMGEDDWREQFGEQALVELDQLVESEQAIEKIEAALEYFTEISQSLDTSAAGFEIMSSSDAWVVATEAACIAGSILLKAAGAALIISNPLLAGFLIAAGYCIDAVNTGVSLCYDQNNPDVYCSNDLVGTKEVRVNEPSRLEFMAIDYPIPGSYITTGIVDVDYRLLDKYNREISDLSGWGIIASPSPGEKMIDNPPPSGILGYKSIKVKLDFRLELEKGWGREDLKDEFKVEVTATDYMGNVGTCVKTVEIIPTAPSLFGTTLQLTKGEVSNSSDLVNQYARFGHYDPDQDIVRAEVRVEGYPVIGSSLQYSVSVDRFFVGNSYATVYQDHFQVFYTTWLRNSIDLSKEGSVWVTITLVDENEYVSNSITGRFYVVIPDDVAPKLQFTDIPNNQPPPWDTGVYIVDTWNDLRNVKLTFSCKDANIDYVEIRVSGPAVSGGSYTYDVPASFFGIGSSSNWQNVYGYIFSSSNSATSAAYNHMNIYNRGPNINPWVDVRVTVVDSYGNRSAGEYAHFLVGYKISFDVIIENLGVSDDWDAYWASEATSGNEPWYQLLGSISSGGSMSLTVYTVEYNEYVGINGYHYLGLMRYPGPECPRGWWFKRAIYLYDGATFINGRSSVYQSESNSNNYWTHVWEQYPIRPPSR